MKNNKGFSLVELIVVIAIMAILAAVAAVSFAVYIDHAKDASDDDYIANVLYRVKLFSMEHGIEVQKIEVSPVVDGPEDIKLIIGTNEDGTPKYYPDPNDPNKNEIYDTVGNYTFYGDFQIDSFIPITPGGSGGTTDNTNPDVTEHTHGDWKEISHADATCKSKGSVTYQCTAQDGCTATKTEEGLFYGDHRGEDAVQAVDGFKVWKCPDCNQIIIKSEDGNAVVPID